MTKRISEQLTYVRKIVEGAVLADSIATSTKVDMRYQGQGLELTLDAEGKIDLAELETAFLKRYEAQVGFCLQDIPIEIVSISVSAHEVCETKQPVIARDTERATETNRDIYDLKSQNRIGYKVIERTALNGAMIDGPAAICEKQTTTLVRPEWSVQRSDIDHLVLERMAP